MNPGVSLHVTGALPIFNVTSRRALYVSSDVCGVRMISTSFIAMARDQRSQRGDLGVAPRAKRLEDFRES